ncbi:Myb-like_DNA-binding domain-containing protein [Hexamita inflata]|uniref:Myb-like DNA-binding domain-containing protein n=1 Tax=Hexamita inflata TaxID=28002 RepID=A0AA86P9J0_9EUKA|nr:Myb-like DNA-binding domain-containing protein [Hexamita inflata]CAI9933441.1 Myb-like DNA-binding domain-containing protein [Hexamita inflata]
MKNTKQQWSQHEIDMLIKLTEKNRHSNSKIVWSEIAALIKTRSQVQCKSYYQITLKPTLPCDIRKNHSWSRLELVSLWTLGVNFDSDFKHISKVQPMFRNFTLKQLQSQWQQLQFKQAEYIQQLQKLLLNPYSICDLAEKLFLQLSFVVKLGFERLEAIRYSQLNNESSYLDQMEMNAIKAFLPGIHFADLQTLQILFSQEHQRRGLEYQTM